MRDSPPAAFCSLLPAASIQRSLDLTQPTWTRQLDHLPGNARTGRGRRRECTSPLGARAYTYLMSETRVIADHRIMGGVPCVRGTRIPVATIVGLLAQGQTMDQILADYPQLVVDDIKASLEFAAIAVSERQVPLRTTA